nr:unnamed protein product [Callosobruchus analis]
MNWFDEVESDFSDYADHNDIDFCPQSDHDTESEIDEEEIQQSDVEDGTTHTSNKQSYCGKNRYKWSAIPHNQNLNIRTKKHNLVKVLPGLKGPSKCGDNADPLQIWSFLFTEEMENEIVLRTNEKILLVQQTYKDPDRTEIRELTNESNDEDLEEMFSTDGTGRDIFRCILSSKRVQLLLTCLRELRSNIGRVLNKQLPIEESRSIQNQKRRRCGICERKKGKKTKISCNKCKRAMCGDCRAYICKNCV